MSWLLVVAGAMVGASLRYAADRVVQSRHDTVFPWGTLTVNVAGCLIVGVVTGAVIHGVATASVEALLGIGFCGGLTTYSTLSYETMRLAETGARFLAFANLTVSVTAGLGAMVLGSTLAAALWATG